MLKQNQDNSNKNYSNNETEIQKKIWKKEYNPLRNIILWGKNNKNNPSFLILYGKQLFKNKNSSDKILEDNVTYTNYAIFEGHENHFPSFKNVEIVSDYRSHLLKMYYKNGYSNYYYKDESYTVKEFKTLILEEQIIFPYFIKPSYEQYIQQIQLQNINFPEFTFAKHPNEILNLDETLYKYYELIYDIISNPNLYIRKKRLKELIDLNPSKTIYDLLLNIGSTELISGLFLELAKTKNLLLIEEAKIILTNTINWADDSYADGVKRCTNIYLTSLNESLKNERINFLKQSLPDIDLHITHINNKDIPENKILEGSDYRKYSLNGSLQDYIWTYDKNNKFTKYGTQEKYKINYYSDGRSLKTINFKNTIQEAEIYQLADVIGKIAYYLDAPRLTYYFNGNYNKCKEKNYFKRYIKKIINYYAYNDPDKFMEAMKYLLTSYTEYDYVCKFKGNFQFNEFIKYYLYYDFNDKAYTIDNRNTWYENWRKRQEWMSNDQLLKLEGRYEFMKDIWDNHIEDVLYIAINAKINTILKACYYILKPHINTAESIENISYNQLIDLAQSCYEPLHDMFTNILTNKLNQLEVFAPDIMITLMGSPNKNIHELAMEFFKRTNGCFTPNTLANLMLLDNFNEWIDLFRENIISLDKNKYLEFIKIFIDNNSKLTNIAFSDDIKNLLSLSIDILQYISQTEKINLIHYIIDKLFVSSDMSEYVSTFIEEIVFLFSYSDLKSILKDTNIDYPKKIISQKNSQIIFILKSIQSEKIPSDVQIISILESGTSKCIKTLIEIMRENNEELNTRFSTLLIMLESNITVLNKQAEEIFDNMGKEKQQRLHLFIIDSPVEKVCLYGLKKLDEIYGEAIPEKFIIQMLEHTVFEVKSYISNKINKILDNLENENKELFMYYVKSLLFLPNKISKSKDNVYKAIPKFALKNKDKLYELENILLDIGGSNIIKDSEHALVTLAQIIKTKEDIRVES